MNREAAEKVANAVLYEGYMLYPYRRSAIKNRQRWTFGILYPPEYREVIQGTERSSMHTECLIEADRGTSIRIQLRFLHLMCVQGDTNERGLAEDWDEAAERTAEFVLVTDDREKVFDFTFAGTSAAQSQAATRDSLSSTQHGVMGKIAVVSDQIAGRLWKLTLDFENTTPAPAESDRNAALLRSLLSAHMILTAEDGAFVSLLDPPGEFAGAARACRNLANFPVLIGNQGERDMMLCSPILLYDYPQIAPESAGDFFDATEMDEMLTLRLMTLTDAEKAEVRTSNDRARDLLDRTEQSAREQLMRTHGTIRSLRRVNQ